MPAQATKPAILTSNHFEVKIPSLNLDVGLFTDAQGLNGTVDVLEYPEGGNNGFVHKLPTRVKYSNLTLKQGLIDKSALLAWFQKVSVSGAEAVDMSLTLYDADGDQILTWSFAGAYPVKWSVVDLGAGANAPLVESLEIAHQGIQAV
jgi:phage tail-like protein